MKIIIINAFVVFFILGISNDAQTQSPYAFNYQGIARDSEGDVLADRELSLLISISRTHEEGIVEFSEQHFITTSSNGLFSIRIGKGEQVSGNLRNIDWGIDKYFIRTEIDPEGGEDYLDLGVSQLYSVPYALYAIDAGNASDGGSADEQTLGFTGTTLSILNGNSVDLSPLKDGVEDGDADPTNEIQTLNLSGNQLSISGSNTVSLPEGATSENEGLWELIFPGGIHYNGEEASIGVDELSPTVLLGSNSFGSGFIRLYNNEQKEIDNNVLVHGEFGHYGFDDNEEISHWLGPRQDDDGSGFLELYYKGHEIIHIDALNTTGAGHIETMGPSGQENVRLTITSSNSDHGFIAAADAQGKSQAKLYVGSDGSGRVDVDGPSGNINVSLTNLNGNPNSGYVAIFDSNEDVQAGIYVNSDGQGVVFADIKNFRTPHPSMADHDIVYASLEGPEAAAYMRGTGTLSAGTATIKFPEHFQHIISEGSMTVMISPLSATSKGMAVIDKKRTGFVVQELLNGIGDYNFDWEVKAVRSGYENYKIVRSRQIINTKEKGSEETNVKNKTNQHNALDRMKALNKKSRKTDRNK